MHIIFINLLWVITIDELRNLRDVRDIDISEFRRELFALSIKNRDEVLRLQIQKSEYEIQKENLKSNIIKNVVLFVDRKLVTGDEQYVKLDFNDQEITVRRNSDEKENTIMGLEP